MKTQWDNLFKVRLSNKVDESMDKHDIIKLMLVRKILRTYRKRHFIRIYCEFKLNGCVPDVYFENIRTKSAVCYEIQKDYSQKWLEETRKKYEHYELEQKTFNSIIFIPIPLKEAPNDINKLNEWLEQYVA